VNGNQFLRTILSLNELVEPAQPISAISTQSLQRMELSTRLSSVSPRLNCLSDINTYISPRVGPEKSGACRRENAPRSTCLGFRRTIIHLQPRHGRETARGSYPRTVARLVLGAQSTWMVVSTALSSTTFASSKPLTDRGGWSSP
jgi:hypothetical protein